MGAERPSSLSHEGIIDASSARKRRSTDPGMGPPSGGTSGEDDPTEPGVVDFDALHAALGELPPAPTSSSPMLGESQGRAMASYASSRPHAIPATRAPEVDAMNAPPVIVQTDDTIPSGPPLQMTVPMAQAPHRAVARGSNRPFPATGAGPTPELSSFAPTLDNAPTVPMSPPPRPRTPTLIVARSRTPTRKQKLLVFVAMLLVFVSGGIAFLVYGKRLGVDIDFDLHPPRRKARTIVMPAASTPGVPPMAAPPLVVAATATVTPVNSLNTTNTTAAASAPAPPTSSIKKASRRSAPAPVVP